MPQVKIRIERGVETSGDGQERQEQAQQEQKQAVASPTQMIFYHQAISTGKQIVGYATSNVANFTGNNLLQDQVNQQMDILSDMTTIALGATRGWAGLAVATVGVTLKKGLQFMTMLKEQEHLRHEQEYLMKRSGNATLNGSRGTEN